MKLSRILLSAVAVATVAACGNLSKVTEAGTPEYKEVDGQQVHNLYGLKLIKQASTMMVASSVHGQTGDNVRMIERGMNKDQLYNLIGRPHFSEVYTVLKSGIMRSTIVRMVFTKFVNTKYYLTKPQCSKLLLVSKRL